MVDETSGVRQDSERSASRKERVNEQRKGESFSRLRTIALERWLVECARRVCVHRTRFVTGFSYEATTRPGPGILETLPAGPGAVAPRERMKELRVGIATGIRRSAGNGETEKGRQSKEKRRKRRGLRAKGGRGEEHAGRIDGGSSVARLVLEACVPQGFGFITFADPASVDKVLAQGNHELDGKKVSNHHILPD
ncbi:RNA-binding protein Musashi like protein Rbp6 [Trachymyrmex cornetzi]|uniref:RNA-binding protein Musashi like protein Rbp6 n=1 Tax=Trachymyrmex cornetzi TaxID=471704 RepID=A0A195EN59_9HYME|nr:RNA-binding protein Musashi like protein Rbp6 [Trachymyrmex cornetzi]